MSSLSRTLFEKAKKIIPGGVNSPVRAFGSVQATPIFIREAHGSRIIDADGREYVDYVMSWGPMMLGHSHPVVTDAIRQAAGRGTSYGAPTELEVEMAEIIIEAIPSLQMIRMVSSGTEAVMSAIRLARGYTGKNKLIKFAGCYHGHADSLLVKAGSGVATLGIPGSPGIPAALAELTITLPFNNIEAMEAAVEQHGDDLACVIVEPVAGNMGVVLPKPGFLEKLRDITREQGILLIFDEVITGFRLAYGGYQNLIHVEPDLTCLGKIIGGGLPVGAFGGSREIMQILRDNRDAYEMLDRRTFHLCDEILALFKQKGLPVKINRAGSMFTLFFTPEEVFDFASASRSDTEGFARYFRGMLTNGVNLAPSQFEAAFLSFAHTPDDVEMTLNACAQTLKDF
jgi:glutamate-1-semialdehyde 2,1-aminomutase